MPSKNLRHSSFRLALDAGLDSWGRFVYRHPWLIIAASLLVVVMMGSQMPKLVVDTSTEGFMQPDDPLRLRYDEFRYQFGRDERIMIVIESAKGDIFERAFLEKLRDFHKDLEANTPKLEKISSLINARVTRGEGDELIVGDFLATWPETDEALQQVKQRALANELYINQFLSADGRYAIIMIQNDAYTSVGQEEDLLGGFDNAAVPEVLDKDHHPPFLTGEENTEIVNAVEAIAAKYNGNGFTVHFGGTPHMVDKLTRILMADMTKFMIYSVLIIVSLLLFAYRRLVMVFVPISVALLSVMTTMGSMALLNIPITAAGQIMPSFLITVGVGNAIHIFALFFQALNRGSSREDAIAYALSHSGLAIIMTGLTTMAGLASFAVSNVKPVADFGIITPLGVGNALLASMVLLPAVMAVLPVKPGALERKHEHSFNQRVLQFCGRISTTHPWKIIAVWAVILAGSLHWAIKMSPSHDPVKWFPEGHPFRVTTELINEKLGGGMFLEVLIDTGKENGLHDPELLRRMDEVHQYASEVKQGDLVIGKSISMVQIVKEIHQALHGNDPAYYAIPDTQELVSQELLLFENSGSEDLRELVDTRFSQARITMKMPFIDAVNFPAFENELHPNISKIIGDKAEVTITGLMGMMGQTIFNLLTSMVSSYGSSILMITLMMILFMSSVRVGLLGMIGNIAPILVTLAMMVICGFPLDAFTLLIGSIGLGLAVDDTIHFLNNFMRYLKDYHDPERAVRETLATAGEAMFFTSVTLAAGFAVYAFAVMENLQRFGILTAFCVMVAFVADITLNPAIMYLFGRRELRRLAAKSA